MKSQKPTVEEILARVAGHPCAADRELEQAVPLARALVAGGIRVLEVTLRTPAALAAIRAMREAVPEAWSASAPSSRRRFARRGQRPAPVRVSPGDAAARRGGRARGHPRAARRDDALRSDRRARRRLLA